MIERDLYVTSAGYRLAGTLCLPSSAGPHPVTLMVHGSGPLDRNENLSGQALNAFNSIAHYLASRGIASLRYDKRGCGESAGEFNSTGHQDLVDDAQCWVRVLEAAPECNPDALYVLGHSEGTAIAPQLYQRNPRIAGLVLLCPFVENLEAVLLRQARQLQNELGRRPGAAGVLTNTLFRWLGRDADYQARLIARIQRSTTDTIRVRLQKVPARWYRELFALDLRAIYRTVRCPVLVLGGEKDLQCNPQDVAEIADLLPGAVTAELVPNLTHVLRLELGKARLSDSHGLLAQPVEPVVIEAISLWLQEQLALPL